MVLSPLHHRARRANRALSSGPSVRLRVGDLAHRTGKTVRALHLYEEMGLLAPGSRSTGGYRLYGADAETRVRWITKLQDMGFSLSEIKAFVIDWDAAASAPEAMSQMRDMYTRKLEETRLHRVRLEALEDELKASLDYLHTCHSCDPTRELHACPQCDVHAQEEKPPELVAGFHIRTHTPSEDSDDSKDKS